MKMPNPDTHFWISLIKSCFRIAAGIALMQAHVWMAGAYLIIAEVLGIAEEIF